MAPRIATTRAGVDTAPRGAPRFDQLLVLLPPYASSEHLLRAYSADHAERVREAMPEQGVNRLDPDTGLNPYSWHAALGCCAVARVGSML